MKPSATSRLPLLLLAWVLALLVPAAKADLVWAPDTGWRIEGGALSLLSDGDNVKAVELMNTARAAQEKGHQRTALRNYARVTKRYSRSIYAPEAYYQTALLRMARQEYSKAFDAFEQLVQRYPNYGKFNEIIGHEYSIADDLANGKRQRLWGFLPGFRNRQRGVDFFEKVVHNAPFSDYGPNALERIAQTHRLLGNTDEEIDALDRFINTYNLDSRAPSSYLDLAKAHEGLVEGPLYDQGSTKEALSYFQDFSILYKDHPRVGEAEKGASDMRTMLAKNRLRMADWYFRYRSNYTAARIFYNEAITIFPESTIAAEAREKIAKVDAAEAYAKAHPPSRYWRYINWLWR